jgi:hypothetical protein
MKQISIVFDIKVDAIIETKCRHLYQTNTYSLLMWVNIETRYWKVFSSTRRNLVLSHIHTLQLLFDLITFQSHLAILSLQMICCIN